MSKTCDCGDFGPHRPECWSELPVFDFVKRVCHTEKECRPFPEWTEEMEEGRVIGSHPLTFGINKMGFFNDEEPHPADCPCGGPGGFYTEEDDKYPINKGPLAGKPWPVHKHGAVCFRGHTGTYAHIEHLGLDWERQKILALSSRKSRADPAGE